MTIAPPLVAIAVVLLMTGFPRPAVRRVDPGRRMGRRLPLPPRRFLLVVTVVGGFLVGGPLPAAVVASAILVRPRIRRIVGERRLRRRIDHDLPTAIEMLVLIVRAGMTPHQAVLVLRRRAPESTRDAFEEVHRRTARGDALADALAALPEILGDGASTVADTLALAERYGTPIADALGLLAADVHERRRRSAEADARRLPIRMSFPLVVCTLPSFVLLAIVPAVLAAARSLDTTGF